MYAEKEQPICGFKGDSVCEPPDCSGACPQGNDLRPSKADPELHAEFNKARIAGFRGLYEEWLRTTYDIEAAHLEHFIPRHRFQEAYTHLEHVLRIESELAKITE